MDGSPLLSLLRSAVRSVKVLSCCCAQRALNNSNMKLRRWILEDVCVQYTGHVVTDVIHRVVQRKQSDLAEQIKVSSSPHNKTRCRILDRRFKKSLISSLNGSQDCLLKFSTYRITP